MQLAPLLHRQKVEHSRPRRSFRHSFETAFEPVCHGCVMRYGAVGL